MRLIYGHRKGSRAVLHVRGNLEFPTEVMRKGINELQSFRDDQSPLGGPVATTPTPTCVKRTAEALCQDLALDSATYEAGAYNRPLQVAPDTARTVITIVSQAFTIAYCAILMLLTQRIALHEFFRRPQTLTAMHDKASAWLGLGSSLQTLANQRKLVTDLLGTFMITLYLLLILVVHTTLPGIFGIGNQNVTVTATYPTTLARQPNIIFDLSGPALQIPGEIWSTIYSILPVYDTLNLTTVGVLDNMLYDIIPSVENVANIGVEVNATTFVVDCGLLSDVTQLGFMGPASPVLPDGASGSDPDLNYVFGFGNNKYRVSLTPMGVNQFQVLPVEPADFDTAPPNMLVLTSTWPTVDSAGTNATISAINPMWEDLIGGGSYNLTITGVNFLECNFNADNSTVSVDPLSRAVDQPATPPIPIAWHDWTDPGASGDPILSSSLSQFAQAARSAQTTLTPYELVLFNDTFNATTSSLPVSLLEQFLFLDISASRNASLDTSGPITVGELNWSIGRAFAAVLWYYNTATATSLNLALDTQGDRLQGQASITTLMYQERLTVNPISLYIGLVASCLLFILAAFLVTRAGALGGDVVYHDISGLLPMLWLLGNEPRLAEIDKPDLDVLRTAGMYEVTGLEKVRRRAGSESIDMRDRVESKGGEDDELESLHPFSKSS
ncbi:hypothetical protein NM688_g1920 [Phlebia brevispora]|uniref:Uncharacterized protein n=1 Tax=Phlebia brevispora TaxID=194682 RepID=A0ACC1TAQ7_9APHY|nr:hypothetical protein NM688_g1920 [Phlebia brevispora]